MGSGLDLFILSRSGEFAVSQRARQDHPPWAAPSPRRTTSSPPQARQPVPARRQLRAQPLALALSCLHTLAASFRSPIVVLRQSVSSFADILFCAQLRVHDDGNC